MSVVAILNFATKTTCRKLSRSTHVTCELCILKYDPAIFPYDDGRGISISLFFCTLDCRNQLQWMRFTGNNFYSRFKSIFRYLKQNLSQKRVKPITARRNEVDQVQPQRFDAHFMMDFQIAASCDISLEIQIAMSYCSLENLVLH